MSNRSKQAIYDRIKLKRSKQSRKRGLKNQRRAHFVKFVLPRLKKEGLYKLKASLQQTDPITPVTTTKAPNNGPVKYVKKKKRGLIEAMKHLFRKKG